MEVTEKKLAANRANAQKSTGPKTNRGKQIASHNAVKHGLYSGDLIIESPSLNEDREKYDSLYQSLLEEFKPEGELEHLLVQRMTGCLWRSHRAARAEKLQIESQLRKENHDDSTLPPDRQEADRLCRVALACLPNENFNKNLSRYQTFLDRRLFQAHSLLALLQKRRIMREAEGAKAKKT